MKNIKDHPIHHESAWKKFLEIISFPKFNTTTAGLHKKYQLLAHIINIGGSHRLSHFLTVSIMGITKDHILPWDVFITPTKIKAMLHDFRRRSGYFERNNK